MKPTNYMVFTLLLYNSQRICRYKANAGVSQLLFTIPKHLSLKEEKAYFGDFSYIHLILLLWA